MVEIFIPISTITPKVAIAIPTSIYNKILYAQFCGRFNLRYDFFIGLGYI